MSTKKKIKNIIVFILLLFLAIAFLYPVVFVVINSFKGKLFISDAPFALPTSETFVKFNNYVMGIEKTGFFNAMKWSLIITVCSVLLIIIFTSMTAYWITRVKGKFSNILY